MSPFNPNQASAIEVGNDAGWVLQFHNVDSDGTIADEPAASVRSDDYYAAIEAHLQDGLVGGAYTIMIEGLIDQDYQTISQARSGRPVVAKLYMFWNDTVAGPVSYLRNIAGLSAAPSPAGLQRSLVAVLHVYNVKRKLGKLTYDTEIKGIEWAYYAMLQPLPTKLAADFYRSVCLDIYDRTQVLINTFPEPDDSGRLTVDAAGKKSSEKVSYPEGKTYGAILTGIANAVQKNRKTYGHSMLLIRDGRIYLGPRPFPLEGDVKALTASTGLLNAVVDGASERDPTAPDVSGKDQRFHFTLTLKGRPDIKPGDVVAFDPAPQDVSTTIPGLGGALAGAFTGPILPGAGDELSDNHLNLAITSVKHQLSKSAGFVTEVKGVALTRGAEPWIAQSDTGAAAKPKRSSPTADAGADAASAIKENLEDWTSNQAQFDIGQVRAFNSVTGSDVSPSQTEVVWEGLREVDQNPNGTRRLPIDDNNAVRMDTPYASPFAWGRCGLVLPRYPGMRVALGHRRGLEHDPVDMGALWDSGSGPDSQTGDWWLSLPVGVDASARAKAADSDDPQPWSGSVSQDLIDADGNRMIELGSLVVRVGREQLQPAGTRPDLSSSPDSITIEHTGGGSQIVMKQDGSILIKGSSITFDADAGDVTIKARKVDVQVAESMDIR